MAILSSKFSENVQIFDDFYTFLGFFLASDTLGVRPTPAEVNEPYGGIKFLAARTKWTASNANCYSHEERATAGRNKGLVAPQRYRLQRGVLARNASEDD